MRHARFTLCIAALAGVVMTLGCRSDGGPKDQPDVVVGPGLSEQEVIDSYIYLLGRYLVLRQEHIDLSEKGVAYNAVKYNELGKAELVNPNLDVAYLEAWLVVDERTPVILEIPEIEPAVELPMFTNADLIGVEAFMQPLLDHVLASAPDAMSKAAEHQAMAREIGRFAAATDDNRSAIDRIIREKAAPALIEFIRSYGDKRGGWAATTGKPDGFGEDYCFRTAANFAGIWWNANSEVVYYIGEVDSDGNELNGDAAYGITYPAGDEPQRHVDADWSLTLLSLPDYRVVPNELDRFNLNHTSTLVREADGSMTIYLGSELPEGAPQSNWLPAVSSQNAVHRFRSRILA